MKTAQIKKTLLDRGLTDYEAAQMVQLAKDSQKKTVFVATVKSYSQSNMSATISICFQHENHFRTLDFYLNKLCGYRWSKNQNGVIVHGCGFNRIYALLDSLADVLQLAGQEKSNFTRYFRL